MRKSALIIAAVALAACNVREESHGEVVDTTVDNSKVSIDLGTTKDTLNVPTFGMETDTLIVKRPVMETDTLVVKKPVYTGRKPVEMKRPTVDVTKKP